MRVASKRIYLMGTFIDTKIWHENPEPLLEQVEELLYLYKDRFSANDLTSELMEVNLNAGIQAVPVASDLFELISLGKEHSCAENSFLNITIGPLVQTWRIGFDDAHLPDEASIAQALEKIDPQDIELEEENRLVYLKKLGMAIDLGALAKGYIADRIVEHLKRVGVKQGLINLGGNVLTFGEAQHNSNHLWKIGIQDPKLPRGNNIAFLQLEEASIVTSGIYERTFELDGKKYHHILDSKTGYPLTSDLASLTIVSKHSIDGEIWTSRLFGSSIKDIFTIVNQLEGIEALLITKENEVLTTDGLSAFVLLHNLTATPSDSTSTKEKSRAAHSSYRDDAHSSASLH